jgi:hypothetical protein
MRHTGVGSASGATGSVLDGVRLLGSLGVEVALSLLGDGDGVLTLVCGRHSDRCGGVVVGWCWMSWIRIGFVKVVECGM